MRWLALAIFMILASGISQSFPLQANNGAVNCTVFGSFKDPWNTGSSNSNSYAILNVDLSLTRINASDKTPIQATYSLMDGNDRIFKMAQEYTRELQLGRRLVGFVVPKETIAKSLIVDLSRDPAGGEQFSLYFPKLSNTSNGNVTMLYYGVLRSGINSNKKMVELDVALTNNGTNKLSLDARNFTLMDQWGWKYDSSQYDIYGRKGLSPVVLESNGTIRSSLIFGSISPLSRPVELIYRYSDHDSLALNIDPESGIGANIRGQERCNECSTPQVDTSATSLAGSIKATKARLAKIKKVNNTESSASKGRDEL